MNILVFNCGSSSLKYKLMELPSEKLLVGGEAQRVGLKTNEPSKIFHRTPDGEEVYERDMPSHFAAFEEVMKLLMKDENLIPQAVGHRVVHGATLFTKPTVIGEEELEKLKTIEHLAPLHNPPAMRLMEACSQLYPDLPQVAVFDTAFHSTIPDYAYTYSLPKNVTDDLGIRKYGFHGTSHQFVVEEAAKLLNKPMDKVNVVSCHLGSGGASLCAVVNGKSIENTMGFSPLQGLVMNTRCGDLDSAIALRLVSQKGGNIKDVETLLNKKSGVLGISGVSADIRDIFKRKWSYSSTTNDSVQLTAQIYLWRIKKYLGAYLTLVGNPDAVIFTDTIGETMPLVRGAVCSDMEIFGIKVDHEKNKNSETLPLDFSTKDSSVRLFVILTNEELAIARQTYRKLEAVLPSC